MDSLAIRGITVCVGKWYSDLLGALLPLNMRHLSECWVVTSPDDERTQGLAASIPGVRLHITDAFTRHGARFNKGLALESGFEAMGRYGWILIHDCDCLMPDSLALSKIEPDKLHGARRRLLENPACWDRGINWGALPLVKDGGPVGFFQLFAAGCPALRGKSPWYDVSFAHAGGGDAAFLNHWTKNQQVVLPIEVLHFGPIDTHWFGTTPDAIDMMAKFVTDNGWSRAASKFTAEQVKRAAPVVERVDVPGYPKSDFDLPFVRRAQKRR